MKNIIILMCIGIIVGCASQPKIKDENDLSFHLTQTAIGSLPDPKVSQKVEDQQLLSTQMRGHYIYFMSLLQRGENGLSLTALSPVGIKLFTVNYDGSAVKVDKYIPNMRLPDVNDIIANIMLAYYGSDAWKDHLPQNWKMVDQNLTREILDQDGEKIMQISYEKKNKKHLPVTIHNYSLKYTINLKNLND